MAIARDILGSAGVTTQYAFYEFSELSISVNN